MHVRSLSPDRMPRERARACFSLRIPVAFLLILVLPLSGCLFRKNKAPAAPTLPPAVRIVLLPISIPQDNEELRWLSLSSTVLMGHVAIAVPDLELVPLWESLPAVLQTLGNSRTITDEIAEFTAARLSARWATSGRIIPGKPSLVLLLDFMPSKPSMVPFRYEKPASTDTLEDRFRESFSQLVRYLMIRPLAIEKLRTFDMKRARAIAQAIDAEYGWFVTARPGEAAKLVEELAATNRDLARFLFNPILYPILGKQEKAGSDRH